MRSRRHTADHANHDRWLISYADFITLLFAFFVVLFAATYRDNQAIRKLSRAIHNGFQTMGAFAQDESGSGGPYASLSANLDDNVSRVQNENVNHNPASTGSATDMLAIKKKLESALGKELANHEIVMQVTPEGFVISLKELGFFDSGQAGLLPGAAEKLARIATILDQPGLEIRVEGHSDNQSIHNAQFNSNWELSTARATHVLMLLLGEGHINPAKLSAAGYGQYRPVASNDTPEGRKLNRRVDLVVVQSRAAQSRIPQD